METIRRNDLSPRIELIPLIDVIFLLLTFFIYSLLVMVRADILPVTLTNLDTGEQATPARIHAITIDDQGQLFFDRKLITFEELDIRLGELAQSKDGQTLYLAMQEQGVTDRGPTLIRLIELVRAAGVTDFVIVGQPQNPAGGSS